MLLEISTAVICPMNCSYCPQDAIGKAYKGPRLMSMDTFRKALENAPTEICVSFAGFAEPYLNRECSRMIGITHSTFHPIQVYTTGVGMTEEDVNTLIRIQPSNVVWHMPDGDGDMKTKITPEYVRVMEKMMKGVERFKSIGYGTLHPMLKGLDRNRQHYPLQSRAGNVVHLAIKQPKRRRLLVCGPDKKLENHVMLPTGELVLCCMDWALTRIIGNLAADRWEKIQAGLPMLAVRKSMMNGEGILCTTCEYAESVQ